MNEIKLSLKRIKMQEQEYSLKTKAVYLAYFTIAYNLIEAAISISLGISEDSISLAGFGGDSLIEFGSAILVLWRLKEGSGRSVDSKERLATRGIGILFLLLSFITLAGSILQIVLHKSPETTLPGIIISLISIVIMLFLWSMKMKVAKALKSVVLEKDAVCTLMCIRLSVVLFTGSILYLIFPSLWWVDSVFAMILSFLIFKEGYDTFKGSYKEDFAGGCGCD